MTKRSPFDVVRHDLDPRRKFGVDALAERLVAFVDERAHDNQLGQHVAFVIRQKERAGFSLVAGNEDVVGDERILVIEHHDSTDLNFVAHSNSVVSVTRWVSEKRETMNGAVDSRRLYGRVSRSYREAAVRVVPTCSSALVAMWRRSCLGRSFELALIRSFVVLFAGVTRWVTQPCVLLAAEQAPGTDEGDAADAEQPRDAMTVAESRRLRRGHVVNDDTAEEESGEENDDDLAHDEYLFLDRLKPESLCSNIGPGIDSFCRVTRWVSVVTHLFVVGLAPTHHPSLHAAFAAL
jgi:hypothetical protein